MSKMSPGLLAFVFATLAVGVPLHGQRKTNVLTAEEIEHAKLTTTNAYDVVEQLRPRWFATRGIAKIPGGPSAPLQGASVRIWVNEQDRKSTRLNSSHSQISYAVFCLKKKKK